MLNLNQQSMRPVRRLSLRDGSPEQLYSHYFILGSQFDSLQVFNPGLQFSVTFKRRQALLLVILDQPADEADGPVNFFL
jgi:hypothetical protein